MGRVQPLIEQHVIGPEIVDEAPAPGPVPVQAAAPVLETAGAAASQPPATDRPQSPPDDPGVKAEYLNGAPKSRFRLF
jgi:uncharacterized membrane-anchored protein